MKPTETTTTPARAAANTPQGGAAGATGAPDAPADLFAALLEGLGQGDGEAVVAAEAAPGADLPADAVSTGPQAAQPADTLLPQAFLAQATPAAAPPQDPATDIAEIATLPRDGRGADAARKVAPATTPAANDGFFAATEAPAARSNAFTQLLASASATTTAATETHTEAAPIATGGDPLAAPLAPALAGHAGGALPAAALAPHQATLPSHPSSPAFAGELGAEVRFMVEAGLQQAELHLNPADLGPIQIQLSLNGQAAEISLAAAHGATRESLQQALPVLREMLAEDGLQLAQAGVSAGAGQGFAQDQAQANAQPRQRATASTGEATASPSGAPRTSGAASLRAGRGMLDLYA